LFLPGLLIGSGCSGRKSAAAQPHPPAASHNHPDTTARADPKLIVTPDDALVGKVALVNVDGRFAVLTFPVGHMPAPDQKLNVYRQGLKAGELKVNSERVDMNVLADIVAGDARAGDEVRDR
jgi:hypothetical protein